MEDSNHQHCPFVQFTQCLLDKAALSRAIYQLQHHSGFNMNLVFYLLWLARARYGRLTKRQLKALEAEITVWHQRVIAELKYTHALLINQADPAVVQIRQALQTEIMRAHAIEQRLLYDAHSKTFLSKRTAQQQLADACSSLVHYCELKNDLLIPDDQAAFVLLFSVVFDDVSSTDIEKQVALLADQFQLQINPNAMQQTLWE